MLVIVGCWDLLVVVGHSFFLIAIVGFHLWHVHHHCSVLFDSGICFCFVSYWLVVIVGSVRNSFFKCIKCMCSLLSITFRYCLYLLAVSVGCWLLMTASILLSAVSEKLRFRRGFQRFEVSSSCRATLPQRWGMPMVDREIYKWWFLW